MKYSIDEIDEMRDLLHQCILPLWCGSPDKEVTESWLRTLMMNGTSVEEVREYHAKKLAKYDAMLKGTNK